VACYLEGSIQLPNWFAIGSLKSL